MLFRRTRKWMVVALLVLPTSALAQLDHTIDAVNLRAGPDRAFPVVAWLPARTDLTIVGCIEDRQWCDVVVGRRRGFVHTRYLAQRFNQRTVPIVTFNVKDYWDAHYTRQSWFPTYVDWVDFGKPGFVPPAPPGSRLTQRAP
jgi:uncharacterized protein YraI